ncbi:F0F1 ATP synthase subunit C [Pseudolactococcus yaeyamensis]
MSLGILALGIAALGAGIGEGLIVSSILNAVSRQPELENKLRSFMFIGIAFIEGTFFITAGLAFILK